MLPSKDFYERNLVIDNFKMSKSKSWQREKKRHRRVLFCFVCFRPSLNLITLVPLWNCFFSPIFLNVTVFSFQPWAIFRAPFYLPEFSNLTGGKGLILKRKKGTFEESSNTIALGQRMNLICILASCLLTCSFSLSFVIGSLFFPTPTLHSPYPKIAQSLNSFNNYLFTNVFWIPVRH